MQQKLKPEEQSHAPITALPATPFRADLAAEVNKSLVYVSTHMR